MYRIVALQQQYWLPLFYNYPKVFVSAKRGKTSIPWDSVFGKTLGIVWNYYYYYYFFYFFLKDWSLLACFVSSTLTKEQVSKERSVFRPLEVVLCSWMFWECTSPAGVSVYEWLGLIHQ